MTGSADTYGMKVAPFVELKTIYRCLVGGETFAVAGDTTRRPRITCTACGTFKITLLSVISSFDCDVCEDEMTVPGDARGETLTCRECGTEQQGGYSVPILASA